MSKCTKSSNLRIAYYFKTFMLDEWEVCLYMITPSLNLGVSFLYCSLSSGCILHDITQLMSCVHGFKNKDSGCQKPQGDHSLLYFAYTCVRDLFIGGGVIYLAKKIIRWWYFTCKKPENIICDGILHVNMFHYFKIPYFTCNFFTKFTYNEYIGPYFLSHVVLRFSPNDLPRGWPRRLLALWLHLRPSWFIHNSTSLSYLLPPSAGTISLPCRARAPISSLFAPRWPSQFFPVGYCFWS